MKAVNVSLSGSPIEDGSQLTFSPDGNLLGCSHSACRATIWDTNTCRIMREFTEDCGYAIAFSQQLQTIACLGSDRVSLRQFDSDASEYYELADNGSSDIYSLSFANNGKLLILTNGGQIRSWNVEHHRAASLAKFGEDTIVVGWLMNDHRLFAINVQTEFSSNRKFLSVQDVASLELLFSIEVYSPFVFSFGSRCIAFRSHYTSSIMDVWDLHKYVRIGLVPTAPRIGQQQLLSPDGHLMITMDSSEDLRSTIRFWDTSTGVIISNHDFPFPYAHMRLSDDADTLAIVANHKSIGLDRTVFLDVTSGSIICETHGHPVLFADNHTFSPSGKLFATASTETSIPNQVTPLPSGTILLSRLES